MPLPEAYPARYRIATGVRVGDAVGLPVVSFRYPPWAAVTEAALELSGLTEEIRYRVLDPGGLIAEERGGGGERVFRVTGVEARRGEDYFAPASVAGPAVLLAPRRGRREGYEGDFTSWAGVGAWTAGLLAEREDLPAEAAAAVRALVADVDDPVERVRRVYAYVQARSHYVSVQLGIGGFQPMSPADVHRYGYGDCKGLTNYTRLLLAAVGVPSYYCVIGVGEREIRYPDFASLNQANHAMLAVPLAAAAGAPADTLWLECTSQTTPANFLGAGSAGRLALLIKDGTGTLVRTGDAAPGDNRRTRATTIALAADGSAAFTRVARLEGASAAAPVALALASEDERHAAARRDWRGASVEVASVSPAVAYEGTAAVGTLEESGRVARYARALGRRLVVPVAAYLPPPPAPTDTLTRAAAVALDDHYVQVDTLRFVLPEGYTPQRLPPATSLAGPQGDYELSVSAAPDGSVVVARALTLRAGAYPAAEAAAIARFAAAVERADGFVFLAGPKT